MGMFNSPDLLNARGDKLSLSDLNTVGGLDEFHRKNLTTLKPSALSPAQQAELLSNWLTAGGPPKAIDLSKMFGDAQAMAPVRARAAAGQGMGGLFGAGLLVGDIAPLKPINQSPLQTAYSAPALPKVGP